MKFTNSLNFSQNLGKIQLKKAIICKSIFREFKKDEPLRANAVNLATFANALYYLNATPLSVAVLAPCAWSENLACSVAWQSVVNSAKRNTAWRGEFDNETVQQSKHGKFGLASVVKMWQCLRVKLAKQKWGGVWAGDFSLSLFALFTRLCVKFKELFYSFHRSFNSSFCLQKGFFRALCLFEIFKRFVFWLFALIIASHFRKNSVTIHKFSVIFAF